MKKLLLLVTLVLASFALAYYLTNAVWRRGPDPVSTSAPVQPTYTPYSTPYPTQISLVVMPALVEEVLLSNGFEQSIDPNCSIVTLECISYFNVEGGMIAGMHNDSSFFLLRSLRNTHDREAQKVIITKILTSIFGEDVAQWIADHTRDSAISAQKGAVGHYYVAIVTNLSASSSYSVITVAPLP